MRRYKINLLFHEAIVLAELLGEAKAYEDEELQNTIDTYLSRIEEIEIEFKKEVRKLEEG